MKLYNKFLIGCLALGALSACTDRFESMNTDPSSLVNVSPAYILPFVQETGVNLDATPYQRGDNLHSQMYCQYFTNTVQGWTSDRYGYNDGWAEPGYWTPLLYYIEAFERSKSDGSGNAIIYELLSDGKNNGSLWNNRDDRYFW